MGAPMGGGAGAPPMGGDMGAPGGMGAPGDPAAAGGGMPPGMMPMGGPEGGAAASAMPKITKKGKQKKAEEQQMPSNKLLTLTNLESAMYNELKGMQFPYRLFGQYEVHLAGQQQPFVIDFAYPELGIGIETDGSIWHDRSDLKERDMQRDQMLANVGWKILRFNEKAVYEHMNIVKEVIKENVVDAAKEMKKKSEANEPMFKKASSERSIGVEDIAHDGELLGFVFYTED
jgi:very-short-patch-repair endonuclease